MLQEKQARLRKKRQSEKKESARKKEIRLAKKRENINARRQFTREVESPSDKKTRLENKRDKDCDQKKARRLTNNEMNAFENELQIMNQILIA